MVGCASIFEPKMLDALPSTRRVAFMLFAHEMKTPSLVQSTSDGASTSVQLSSCMGRGSMVGLMRLMVLGVGRGGGFCSRVMVA